MPLETIEQTIDDETPVIKRLAIDKLPDAGFGRNVSKRFLSAGQRMVETSEKQSKPGHDSDIAAQRDTNLTKRP